MTEITHSRAIEWVIKKNGYWLPSFQLSTHTMLDPINDITICIKIKIINKDVRQ